MRSEAMHLPWLRQLSAVFGAVMMSASLLTSCVPLQQNQQAKGKVIPVTPVATFADAASDAYPGETMVVIRDQAAWQAAWDRITRNRIPPANLPPVDFSSRIVLLAASGTKPTGGYSIAIVQATEDNGAITVEVTPISPGANCVVPQLVTSPVDIGTIPQTSVPITFNITRKTQNC